MLICSECGFTPGPGSVVKLKDPEHYECPHCKASIPRKEVVHVGDEIDKLSNRRRALKILVKHAHEKFFNAYQVSELYRQEWFQTKLQYEKVDKQLAEIDGRMSIVKHVVRKKRSDKPIEILSPSEFSTYAKKLTEEERRELIAELTKDP